MEMRVKSSSFRKTATRYNSLKGEKSSGTKRRKKEWNEEEKKKQWNGDPYNCVLRFISNHISILA